jgi:hypothetical protein
MDNPRMDRVNTGKTSTVQRPMDKAHTLRANLDKVRTAKLHTCRAQRPGPTLGPYLLPRVMQSVLLVRPLQHSHPRPREPRARQATKP